MNAITVSPLHLGHYRILRCLGSGGMSEIYLACDEREQREVALKVVDMMFDDNVQRFQREVETLRVLKHDHILPIFDTGQQDGWSYFAMPYLPRGSLRERLRDGPLTLQEAGGIFEQVADALHYAHERGVLHRDIKPSNILFRNERDVYLADFGLAKLVEFEGSITQTGCLIGTPHYLAPELATEDASPKSDLYALGILLYKMLTGKVPFEGGNAVTICWKHIHDQPLPPSSLNPAIPPAIDSLILRALEKDPAHRFSSVRQISEAYRQTLHELKQTRETGRMPGTKAKAMGSRTEDKTRMEGETRAEGVGARAEASSAPTNHEARERTRRLVGAELASVLAPNASTLVHLKGFYRVATAGAMIVMFCVAPLYLGFSLYREHMGPEQLAVGFQPTSAFVTARPPLQGNARQTSGQGRSVPLTLFPGLPPAVSLSPSISNKSLPTRKALSSVGESQGKHGEGQLHAKGKQHLHKKGGKRSGHGGHKNKKA